MSSHLTRAGSVTKIGSPVSGGTANEILYLDASGNLQESSLLANSLIWTNASKVPTATGALSWTGTQFLISNYLSLGLEAGGAVTGFNVYEGGTGSQGVVDFINLDLSTGFSFGATDKTAYPSEYIFFVSDGVSRVFLYCYHTGAITTIGGNTLDDSVGNMISGNNFTAGGTILANYNSLSNVSFTSYDSNGIPNFQIGTGSIPGTLDGVSSIYNTLDDGSGNSKTVGVNSSAYFETTTAPTANSTGVDTILDRTAVGTHNAGWMPFKTNTGAIVYIPYWA